MTGRFKRKLIFNIIAMVNIVILLYCTVPQNIQPLDMWPHSKHTAHTHTMWTLRNKEKKILSSNVLMDILCYCYYYCHILCFAKMLVTRQNTCLGRPCHIADVVWRRPSVIKCFFCYSHRKGRPKTPGADLGPWFSAKSFAHKTDICFSCGNIQISKPKSSQHIDRHHYACNKVLML